jgi:uncharacterized protein
VEKEGRRESIFSVSASLTPRFLHPLTPMPPLALVTGASSGIGLEIARLLAGRGYRLVLTARSEERLRAAADEVTRLGAPDAEVVALDLSDDGAVARLVVALEGAVPDALVNNAGFGTHGPLAETDADATHRMVTLNVTALTDLTRALLPGMVARGSGRILNVASTAAFQPGPFMAVYYASKAYVLSFSEALHDELRGTGVTSTCLCPGPTETDFQRRAGIEGMGVGQAARAMPDARAVAEAGVRAMHAGRRLVVPGALNRVGTVLAQLAPRGLAIRFIRRLQEARDPGR